MKCFFITYGDEQYTSSKKRILQEALSLNMFDEVIGYGPADLGLDLMTSKVMEVKRGGGLWSWKPYIIDLTLKKMEEGDVLVYCDAGCSLTKSAEWNYLFNKLSRFNMVFFLLHKKNKSWSRNTVINHFSFLGEFWKNYYQVSATSFILKKKGSSEELIKEWKELMINCPDLVLDVTDSEKELESKFFIENRHDQSILSGLVYKYIINKDIHLDWNNFEGFSFSKRAVVASRIADEKRYHQNKYLQFMKYCIKKMLNVLWYSPELQYWENKNSKYVNNKEVDSIVTKK